MSSLERHGSGLSARASWLVYTGAFFIAVAMVATGCSSNLRTGEFELHGIAKFNLPAFPETGGNKVEVFNEMHYQPSFRSQEGPRLLPPPESVPVTGKELRYATLEEYKDLEAPATLEYDVDKARSLYGINCQVCHGAALQGEGPILKYMTRGPFPADLTDDLTQSSTSGELFAFISRGGRQGLAAIERDRESQSPMPEFQRLLTAEERWMLVMYLRSQ